VAQHKLDNFRHYLGDTVAFGVAKTWKDGLLSSGFPLEFDVMNVLLANGFHVNGEQPFTRHSRGAPEEHSVDIFAHHYVPLKADDGNYSGQLLVLCECKYRRPGKSWLFMPDLNDPDFSPSMLTALRSFYSFTTYTYNSRAIGSFCAGFPTSLKGVEVQTDTADVYDTDIRHALHQLRYAMPELFVTQVLSTLFGHPDDCKPIFFLPLIVTNAPLRMLHDNVTLDSVLRAESLDDLSDSLDIVDIHSPYSQDFRSHCERIFAGTCGQASRADPWTAIKRIEEHYKQKHKEYINPLVDLRMLAQGFGDPGSFSQFLVVTRSALPGFLTNVTRIVKTALRSSKQFIFSASK
jgi:hypothetical protein